jgi:hypothetical protein
MGYPPWFGTAAKPISRLQRISSTVPHCNRGGSPAPSVLAPSRPTPELTLRLFTLAEGFRQLFIPLFWLEVGSDVFAISMNFQNKSPTLKTPASEKKSSSDSAVIVAIVCDIILPRYPKYKSFAVTQRRRGDHRGNMLINKMTGYGFCSLVTALHKNQAQEEVCVIQNNVIDRDFHITLWEMMGVFKGCIPILTFI